MYEYESVSNESLLEFFRLPIPSDIKRKIYEDHFKRAIIYTQKYNLFVLQLDSLECRSLNPTNLLKMVKTIIENPKFLEFMRYKHELFSSTYEEHYIKCRKSFRQMGIQESLALSMLMYLYH